MKLDILAIGVHPDDVELSCSGTLLRHIAEGKKVGLLDLTRGELGTRGSAEIRDEEAANSAKLMGALVRENLGMADGFFQNDKANQLKIIQILRKYQPEIVLANATNDRHPDHGRAAKLTHDACFLAGLVKVETLDGDGNLQDRWRPKAVYHYIQDYDLKPDFVVDITDFMDKKIELIQTFKSQFYNPDSKEPESPISTKAFLDSVIGKNRGFGRPAGTEFAEGFNVVRPMMVKDLFDLR
ncbi:MAG: bacillithiol biosynthesis deacetylase BshB1 [Polaribacter sp.]|jgi:bacillithiol biosynthesis deacetylase BshB1